MTWARLLPWRRRRRLLPRALNFTAEGWWFCAVALGVGFAAMNTGNNLLYLLLGMLLSLIIASGVLSEMALRGVLARRLPPLRIHAGRPFLMGISLNNSKRRLPSFSIEIEDLCDHQLLDKKCYFLKIPAGRVQQTSYRHGLERRGRYVFTGFRISTKFPFALFRKSRHVDHESEVIVFPELVPLSHLPASLTTAQGDLSQGQRGRRGRFHGLREYRPGDDPRDIHWRSSARRGQMMVREYEDEAVRQVTIYVDNSLTEAEEDDPAQQRALERVVSWAASLSSHYLEQGWAVRLLARGGQVPLSVGVHNAARLLTFLALLPTERPEVAFPEMLGPRRVDNTLILVRPGRTRAGIAVPGQVVEAT